jgi:hypothetical protein
MVEDSQGVNCMSIPFTQFLRPNGRRVGVRISRPEEVETKARAIMDAGYWFEVEELTTGHASLTVTSRDQDEMFEVVPNGPEVPPAVDRLINRFYERMEGKP